MKNKMGAAVGRRDGEERSKNGFRVERKKERQKSERGKIC